MSFKVMPHRYKGIITALYFACGAFTSRVCYSILVLAMPKCLGMYTLAIVTSVYCPLTYVPPHSVTSFVITTQLLCLFCRYPVSS